MNHSSPSYALVAALAASCIGASALGQLVHDLIGIELRPATSNVAVGDVVEVGIYAVREPVGTSNFPPLGERFFAIDLFFSWNAQDLRLLGVSGPMSPGTAPGLASSGFLSPSNDYTGLNESSPPADGDGFYMAQAPLGQSVPAIYEGTLVATFRFEVLREFSTTSIVPIESVVASATGSVEPTRVLDAAAPGYDSTGSLGGAVLSQGSGNPCPANLVTGPSSPAVDGADLAFLLGAWGAVNTPANIIVDAGSPTVDGTDLAVLLGAWGTCGG